MKGKPSGRARRVSVTDQIAAARRYDCADAFELRLEGQERCSPEEWVRAGVDATPAWICDSGTMTLDTALIVSSSSRVSAGAGVRPGRRI